MSEGAPTRNRYGCRCDTRAGWRVTVHHGNYSAFNGYKFAPSAYSEIVCDECGARWRTKAAYVEELPRR